MNEQLAFQIALWFWAAIAGVIVGRAMNDSNPPFVMIRREPPTEAPPPEAFK